MENCVEVPFNTEKLLPHKTLYLLQAKEILSERILDKIFHAVSISAIGLINTTRFQAPIENAQKTIENQRTTVLPKFIGNPKKTSGLTIG
ncbi:hypothetical protein G9A89_011606 [Geosiphon pyriformis]|nr:hypothetical protein G9A89_011606 [Geosiphon pyriformis]